MPKLREVVDPDTGEVYHVETTRQAKRRHQRSAGVPKATLGQINAADIWNKQEEKIKKDREREERKKRNKEKEEIKEARLRELQEEKLRLGRITIEDTWGKVNASQNRLHVFFGPPKKAKDRDQDVQLQNVSLYRKEVEQPINSDRTNMTAVQQMEDDLLNEDDLEKIFTGSPLSPEYERTTGQRHPLPDTSSFKSHGVQATEQLPPSTKRKHPQSSTTMMPPPKRPRMPPCYSESPHHDVTVTDQLSIGSTAQTRPPLSEMTTFQLNVRASEKTCPVTKIDELRERHPVATQVVRDTLSALCSQDLDDDYVDDKENASPLKSFQEVKAHPREDEATIHDIIENLGDEEFDEDGIDDEALLALAATQQIRKGLQRSSKQERRYASDTVFTNTDQATHIVSSPRRAPELATSTIPTRKLDDSFTMDDMSDDDLLQGLEVYENQTKMSIAGKENYGKAYLGFDMVSDREAIRTKKRRVLPWVKNPIPHSSTRAGHNGTPTSSPYSQLAEE